MSQMEGYFVLVFKALGQLTKQTSCPLITLLLVFCLNTPSGIKNCCYSKREKFAAFAYNCKIAGKSAILKYA